MKRTRDKLSRVDDACAGWQNMKQRIRVISVVRCKNILKQNYQSGAGVKQMSEANIFGYIWDTKKL